MRTETLNFLAIFDRNATISKMHAWSLISSLLLDKPKLGFAMKKIINYMISKNVTRV